MDEELYNQLDKFWRLTCKVTIGRDVGELSLYENWLKQDLEPVEVRNSIISGKDVFAVGKYPKDSKFIRFKEVDYSKTFPPLDINEIKDIDSIREALGERAVFSGDLVLGDSSHVESSTGIEDCHFTFGCHTFHKSKNLAYCTIGREVESSFGSSVIGESSFNIKGHNVWRTSRCFNVFRVYTSSDILFSNRLDGCSECLFCFGLKGKRHMVGNANIGQEKYKQLKKKLISELADELEKNKRLLSLPGFVPTRPFMLEKSLPKVPTPEFDETKIQLAFDETCGVILGKKIGNIRDFSKYLTRNIRNIRLVKSAVSELKVFADEYAMDNALISTNRVVKLDEADVLCVERSWPEGISVESFSLADVGKLISPVALVTTEERTLASNIAECSTAHYASDVLRCSRAYHAKECAYCCWPRDCDHMFGCDATRNSSFCINCYNSYRLTRCFETDTSEDCTGCMFVHNCENVHDSMFCFNIKSKRYAIANVELGREKYLKIRKLVLEEILAKLERDKWLDLSIYNLGAKK